MGRKTINEHINEFTEELLLIKNRSPKTVRAYNLELNYIFRQIDENRPHKIESSDIKRRLMDFSKKGNQPVTIARKIRVLNSFFSYLVRNDVITVNPMDKIDEPKLPKKIKHVFPRKTIMEIIDYYRTKLNPRIAALEKEIKGCNSEKRKRKLEERKKRMIMKRDYRTLMLRVLYRTMVRCSELISIKVRDIDFNEKLLIVHGKGNKERLVPLDDETIKMMKRTIERRNLRDRDNLFLTRFGEPYSSLVSIENIMNRIQKDLGLRHDLTPHSFRRAGGSHFLQRGADLSAVQDILGHASPQTTRLYAQTNKEGLKKAYKKFFN